MVRKNPDKYQWWEIIDEETMVRKYDFEEEIYVLYWRIRKIQNYIKWPELILEKEILEALENVKLSFRNEF